MVGACKSGFTLIELMVVIVIIGILATLAIPKITAATVKARVSESCAALASYEKAQLIYLEERGVFGTSSDFFVKDPCAAGYSRYFDYAEDVTPDASAKLTGTAKGSVGAALGAKIWTVLTIGLAVTHDCDDAIAKYAPNWRN